MTTGLRVVFSPEHVTVISAKTVKPRATLSLVGFGRPPSQLAEAKPLPCSLQFFVSYQNLVRTETPTDPKLFATLTGNLARTSGVFAFTGADDADPLVHEPTPPPDPDADPRLARPLEYALVFDATQFSLGEQALFVPRFEEDATRFVEIKVQVDVGGQTEVSLDTSDTWDVPYAPLKRQVRFHVIDPDTNEDADLVATNSADQTALTDIGERGDQSRDFDLTALPPNDEYELELNRGTLRVAPAIKIKLRELELGLLLDDASRAAQAVATDDSPVPDPLTGSETHNFGNLPFDETPGSSLLAFTIVGEDNQPLAGRPFVATFADGSVQNGTLDSQGQAVFQSPPPGDVEIALADDADAVLAKASGDSA